MTATNGTDLWQVPQAVQAHASSYPPPTVSRLTEEFSVILVPEAEPISFSVIFGLDPNIQVKQGIKNFLDPRVYSSAKASGTRMTKERNGLRSGTRMTEKRGTAYARV